MMIMSTRILLCCLQVLLTVIALGGTGRVLLAADLTLASESIPRVVYFAADGKSVIAHFRDQHIRRWDLASGKMIADHKAPSGTMLLTADSYVTLDQEKKTSRLWDLSEDRQRQMINGTLPGRPAISADRKLFAGASASNRAVQVWDLSSGERRHLLPDGIGGAASLAFSPDGETLVSANYDNDVRIWKTKSGELVRKVEDLTGAMFAVEFTPDGKQILMAGLDETIYVLDSKTFAVQRKLKGHGETISSLAVSPDGRTFVTGGFDVLTSKNPVKVAIWDLASGKITRRIQAPHQVVSLAFSPDGQWIAMAAGEKEVSLWRLQSK
jgi:WD40 repeat protein